MVNEIRNLTHGPIFKQLLKMAMPLMAINFLQMAYTLTDMAWLGHLSSKDIAAVGAIGIVIWLLESLALTTKRGAEIKIAQHIGANLLSEARKYASHNLSISFIMGITISFLLWVFSDPVISLFRLEQDVADLAKNYLQIVCFSFPTVFLSLTFTGIFNGLGRPEIPFYYSSTGFIFNMILDPLLIYGYAGLPRFGIEGAAIATMISQFTVLSLFIWKTKAKGGVLNRFPYFIRLQKKHSFEIFKIGLPNALLSCVHASTNLFTASIASIFGGHIGVMSQTTGGQIEGICWHAADGFSSALGAFVAQNHAAKKTERTIKAYKYTLFALLILGFVVSCFFYFFGNEIFSLFVNEKTAVTAGGDYLKIVAFCQVFMVVEITAMGMWNGYGNSVPPSIVSIIFNVARIPMALLFGKLMGITGVWWALTISCMLKGIVSPVWWYFRYSHK